jgi:hypothetical protein
MGLSPLSPKPPRDHVPHLANHRREGGGVDGWAWMVGRAQARRSERGRMVSSIMARSLVRPFAYT